MKLSEIDEQIKEEGRQAVANDLRKMYDYYKQEKYVWPAYQTKWYYYTTATTTGTTIEMRTK